MAHIYRIILLLFSSFTSISFGGIEPNYYWINRNGLVDVQGPTAEIACSNYANKFMDKYPHHTINILEKSYYSSGFYMCYMLHFGNGWSDERFVEFGKTYDCPKNSRRDVYSKLCECYSGFFEQNGKCVDNKYKCPIGAIWNEGAKACLCSDGLQPSGGSCTIPETPSDKEDDYCKPSGVIKQLALHRLVWV